MANFARLAPHLIDEFVVENEDDDVVDGMSDP